ncbi:hypothetical protein C8Q80DRAFT_426888 [Daedaleopsis nitida]|nr:hypothetical protein C8Q80DRAFT_426782 [Daedaleopsis nitida]KAI0755340.1 hypothetical protein C8Q80DRAFT_426888 [Daedaleopsis nitida]
MPRLCGGSQSNLAERRTIFPRQTLSIVPVATGTDSAPTGTPATDDTGATSPAPSGALTSAPSSPTGRQDPQDGTDPQDSTTAVDGTDPTTGPSDGVSDGTTKGTSSSTTTNSNDTTTKPSDGTCVPYLSFMFPLSEPPLAPRVPLSRCHPVGRLSARA